jgi:hypothetical protein
MISYRENVPTTKFWQKSKDKNPKKFRKFTRDIVGAQEYAEDMGIWYIAMRVNLP